MRIGLALPHYDFSFPDGGEVTFERVAGYARRAEELGFHEVWVSDHLWFEIGRYGGQGGRFGTVECWTTLAALAARTERVRLGSLVMPVGLRPPSLLAKMAATLDQVSGGRLDLGLGAGWYADEFIASGLEFPPPGERVAMVEEALRLLAALLDADGAPASFDGRHFRVKEAVVVPGPVQRPHPPLWVGARGERMLGVVARAADGWNTVWAITPEVYERRLEVLRATCRQADRPFDSVRRSVGLYTLVGRDADDLAARWGRLRAWAPGGALDAVELADWAEGRLVGTPAEVADQLRGWQARGVEQMICCFANLPFAVFEEEQLDLFAELVMPRLA